MPSGADLEYTRLLKRSRQSSTVGMDGARLAQLEDENGLYIPRRGNKAIGFGDSVMQGGDTMTGMDLTGSWFSKLCALSNQKLRFLSNMGIGGNNTRQMLARIQTDVIDKNPDICVFAPVTPNDTNAVNSVTESQSNIRIMLDMLLKSGIEVICVTCPPSDTAATRDYMNRVNYWFMNVANSYGLHVFDIYTPLADPDDGTYLSTLTADGVHPNGAGHTAIINYLNTRLPSFLRETSFYTAGKVDVTNLVSNGTFQGDSNADGYADSWSKGGGPAGFSGSLVAGAPKGQWQQITSDGTLGYVIQNIPVGSGFNIGDIVAGGCRYQNPNGLALKLKFDFTGGSGSFIPLDWSDVTADGACYMEAKVPAGTTQIQVQLIGNSVANTARFGQVTLRNLTTLGLV